MISPFLFNSVVQRLRDFCLKREMIEVHPQSRKSILAACEDPSTIATFNYLGQKWPLPQTGQMWLEYEMLKNPQIEGFFCVSTSYRQEPNPIPGRHETIFPMFEFEIKGGMPHLKQFEKDLLVHLGYSSNIKELYYDDAVKILTDGQLDQMEIDADHEQELDDLYGPVYFLKYFPEYTSPFWNMSRNQWGLAQKIDVIMNGMETIGSAERSCDPEQMSHQFHTISNGEYAQLLFKHFGPDRVLKELEEFLSLDFFPRSGGGIGVTRLIRSLQMEKILDKRSVKPNICD